MKGVCLGAIVVLSGGCRCGGDAPRPPPPPVAHAPVRGAAGDADLRLMLAEVASAKACALVKGQFRPLRAADNPELATGILWIRECRITHDGARVTFRLGGSGWQWVAQAKHKAGATFALAQQVRFDVDAELPGALDVAYDRRDHVLSLWFTPSARPAVRFTPTGDFDVDERGAWASVVGALGSIFGSSPEEQAAHAAKSEGAAQMQTALADGLAVTIDLCTGLSRFNLGRPPKGAMQPPDVGEAHQVPFEVQPSGLMVLGPYLAPRGMTADVDVLPGGILHVAVMCHAEAERVAAAFLAGREVGDARTLAAANVIGSQTVRAGPADCPVAVVARAVHTGLNAPVRFTWKRPARESARSTGGPLIQCARAADRGPARPPRGH